MIRIREKAPRISDAINAMIKGVQNHEEFGIDELVSDDFLDITPADSESGYMCWACFATAALASITNVNVSRNIDELSPDFDGNLTALVEDSRNFIYDADEQETCDFERAIDGFRGGRLRSLFEFYGVYGKEVYHNIVKEWSEEYGNTRWYLKNKKDLEEQLPRIEKFRDICIAHGV